MKAPLLMIAALMGTAAIAQTTPDANAPASTPPAASTDATAPVAPATSMDATAPVAPAASVSTTAPTAPPATSDGTLGVANNAQTATDTSNYPVCSRSVTDKCVQRGAAHKARRHH